MLCRVMGVARSGYYKSVRPDRIDKEQEHTEMLDTVRTIAHTTHNTYGSRRMRMALHALGHSVSRKKARKLMRECDLKVRYKRQFRSTRRGHDRENCFDNILARNFKPATPNTVYVGDITYIWTAEGWLYVAVVIDLYSRRVVGWAMSSRMEAKLVCDALMIAVWQRKPKKGLIVHSDRGAQYTSQRYRKLLQRHGFIGSMSRPGNCWDNAVCESFFGKMKQEKLRWTQFATRKEAYESILDYITMFYNPERLHSTLGYKSPSQFEAEAPKKTAPNVVYLRGAKPA